MKTILLIILMIIQVNFVHSLIVEEIYYNGDKSEISGKKQYLYDNKNNIIQINILDSKSVAQAVLKYSYKNNVVTECEEFNGKTKVKYSKFEYVKKLPVKKTDYDISDRIVLINEYSFDEKNLLVSVVKKTGDGAGFGRTEFGYENGNLSQEILYDDNNKVVLYKKYSYKEDKINAIEFYSDSGIKIRVIERKYSGAEVKSNKFGFNESFYDLR